MKHEAGWARLWAVVRRRRWAVIGTTVAASAVGVYLVNSMEPQYQARSIVRIDDPRPGKDFMPSLVNEPDTDRLKSVRMTFLAQPIVAEAAEANQMLPPATEETERSLALARTSAHLDAKQEGTDTFVLTYEDSDPARAKGFLGTLVSKYSALRNAEVSSRAAATVAFLSKQIDELRPRVAAANGAVEKVRGEHYGALPDQLEANLRMLDDNELTVHATMASIDAAEGRRRDILSDTNSALRHQEEAVARDLSIARTRYAADAPEVKNLQAEMARVQSARAGDESLITRKAQTSAEMRSVQEQIDRLKGQMTAARQRSTELRTRIDAAAKNGEAFAQLILDRDVLRDRLKSLVTKHEEATLSAGLESGVAGHARVTTIEPAWVGAVPVKPSKPLFFTAAIALALALGLGIGYLLDGLDRRVLATEDVRSVIGDVPILGVVPRLDRLGRAANSNQMRAVAAAAGSES